MQSTQIKRRRLRPMANAKTRGDGERAAAEQRKIAEIINGNPREMINASNLFLCGWLARDSAARESA